MRILHISNDYYNSGVYPTLHDGFEKAGITSAFFVPMSYSDPRRDAKGAIEAHCFNRFDRFFYMNKQRKVYNAMRHTIKEFRPEMLHGYFWFSGGISCLWAKKEFGIPYVLTIQNTDVNFIYKRLFHLRPLGWKILREAEHICFVSESYYKTVTESMVPKKYREEIKAKSSFVPFALDPLWIENANTEAHPVHNGPLRILTVGLVNESKNQQRTAKAIEILKSKGFDIEWTVIGATGSAAVDKEICKHPFTRRIGKIPMKDLIPEYRRADLFVLPSLAESFGLVYAEALSQGIPVIYSKGQGFDGQFPEGYVGYRVDATDANSIAKGIEDAIINYDTLQKNSVNAIKKFTQELVCNQSIKIYSDNI